MQILMAGIVYVIVNFAIAAVWNIVLFKAKYDAMTAGFQRDEPIFSLGIAAMAINMALTLWLFKTFYPAGRIDLKRALGLTALVSIPNASYAALVVPAKYQVTDLTSFVLMELAFAAILILALGGALAMVFSRSTE